MSRSDSEQFPQKLSGISKAPDCPHCRNGRGSGLKIRFGFYSRKSDGKRIQRYRCLGCDRTFSDASEDPCFGQKKRKLNRCIYLMLGSVMCLRRCARVLGVHRTTVARKLQFLGAQGRLELERQLSGFVLRYGRFSRIQFDELETFEHSKLKPVSVPAVVDARSRLILGLEACSMPAKGKLAQLSRKKYGKRADHRRKALRRTLESARPWVLPDAEFLSDSCPRYPRVLKACFPQARHRTVNSRRGCIVGQGELKRGGFDPIFSLNHAFATLRADNSRLIRRTWNTTKRISRLEDHLVLCAVGHNQRILESLARGRRKLS